MKIIKRDCKIVNFEENKIHQSILSAAKDADFSLTESDLSILTSSVKDGINFICNENRIPSSLEVKLLVFETLIDSGFKKVADSYIDVR